MGGVQFPGEKGYVTLEWPLRPYNTTYEMIWHKNWVAHIRSIAAIAGQAVGETLPIHIV